MPVFRDHILPPHPSTPPDIPIDSITTVYQPPRIEDETIDVDAIEPDLNPDFEMYTCIWLRINYHLISCNMEN